MVSNEWLTGVGVTYIVAVLCVLAIIMSLKWYRPATKLSGPVSLVVVCSVIAGLASFDMLSNSRSAQLPSETEQAMLYKQIYWQQKDDPEFSHAQAMKLWSEYPTENSKLLLGLSYLQAGQLDKGVRIVAEAAQRGNSGSYLSKSELKELAVGLVVPTAGDLEVSDSFTLSKSANEYADIANRTIEAVQLQLSDEIEDRREQDLLALAQINPQRLDYLNKVSVPVHAETEEVYRQTVERVSGVNSTKAVDLAVKVELAKTAIYMNDGQTASELLIDVLQHYPDATEPAILLGDILLNGRTQLAEQQLESLSSYAEAKLRQQKDEKLLLEEWSEQVRPGDSEAAEVVSNRLEEIQSKLNIQPHLAYTLLQPHVKEEDPQVNMLLSTYYYQTNNLEQSSAYIHQLADNPAKLTTSQQYYVQALNNLPEASEMSVGELQERNELTNRVYQSFRTLEGKRANVTELTDSEKGFAVYLSNELIQFQKSSLRITSIQANESGEVELYISADNMPEMVSSSIQINDNAAAVSTFTFEKVGQSANYARNIVLIADRSGSMQGERIEGVKLALQSFIRSMNKSERVGLIAFNDYAEVLNPITTNLEEIDDLLGRISEGGGTHISAAFDEGLNMIEAQSGERILFMLSDGEDSQFSDPETRAAIIQRANETGVTIFAIGFATGYETLREVAEATGGRYIASAGLDSLLSSFGEIKRTLESSYKITYKLNPMDPGLHRVRITGPDNKSTSKTYTIDREASEDIDLPVAEQLDYLISGTSPNRIIASASGVTNVQITGLGFDQVEKVTFDNRAIKFIRKNDGRIDITVSNNQSIGIHDIKLIAKDLREAAYHLSVTKSGDQEYRIFGDARVYGDFIQDDSGVSKLLGNTSVDHFIYDSKGAMTLTGGRELTFSGMMVAVDKTKIGLLPAAAVTVGNVKERYLPDNVTMTVNADQKTFDVSRSNIVRDVLDKFTLGKFGLEVYLAPQFTYEAKVASDEGTLLAKAGIKGFSSLTGLNDTLSAKWTKALKFMPSDVGLELGYEKENIIVSGELGAALNFGTLVETGTVMLTAAYEHGPGKLDLGMEIEDFSTQFRAFSFDLKHIPINKFGLKVGWQGSMLPKAGEILLGSPKGVPLASTGLTLRMMKVGIDTRDGFGGLLGVEIGTAVDGPAQEVITWINKLPLIEISDSACVLCVEGEAGLKNLGTANWSVNGAMGLKVIGFETAKTSAYIDVNEISAAIAIEHLNLVGNNRLLWKDHGYNGDLTITTRGSVDFAGLEGELVVFMNANRFDRSYLDLIADTWLYDPHIHIGADAVVYR